MQDALEATMTAETPVALLNATTAMLNEFARSVEAISGTGEEGGIRKLSDAMAEIMKATAQRVIECPQS